MISKTIWTATALTLASLTLAGCARPDRGDWTDKAHLTTYAEADSVCETQMGNIQDQARRGKFYVECMKTQGWTPRPGSEFANPAKAPVPG